MLKMIDVSGSKTTGFKYSDEFFAFLSAKVKFYIEMTGHVFEVNENTIDFATTQDDWRRNGCRIYTQNGYIKIEDVHSVIMDVPENWQYCFGIDEVEENFYR